MLTPGTIIDEKYEIVCQLGHGGYGRVYRANQLQFDRPVAIKMLDTTLLYESDGPARFEREAKAISAVQHKNIISFYGFGSWQGAPYMVMELVTGTSLDDMLSQDQQIDADRAVALMTQVFEALSCAHAAGVIHRDLKPSNIMVHRTRAGDEQIKIIDFGLVKLMPGYGMEGQKLTETGYACGTCQYMAPEQALGESIDQRSDIYAAGCILYQMLSGHRPFDGDDNIQVMFQHLNMQPEPLARYLPNTRFSQNLIAIVENCLTKDPKHRYQECGEILADIKKLNDAQSSKIRKHQTSPSSLLPRKRNTKLELVAVSITVSAVLFGVGYKLWSAHQVDQPAASATQNDPISYEIYHGDIGRVLYGTDPGDAYKIMSRLQTENVPPVRRFCCWVQLANYFRNLSERSFAEKGTYIKDTQHCIDEATALFQEKQIAADPSLELYHWKLARLDVWYERTNEAIPIFHAIIANSTDSEDPDRHADSRAELAQQYVKSGNKAKALEVIAPAPQLVQHAKDGSKAFVLGWAGDAYYLNGNNKQAAVYYNQVWPLEKGAWKDKLRALIGMTYIRLQEKNYEDAKKYADLALKYSILRSGSDPLFPASFEAQLAQMSLASIGHNSKDVERFRKEAIANAASYLSQSTATSETHRKLAYEILKSHGHAADIQGINQALQKALNDIPKGGWIRKEAFKT